MAIASASQTDTPSWLIQYVTNAPAVMTAANARLSTSVTANCRVNPTAAIASTAEVISPKPTDAMKMLMALSRDRAELGSGDVAGHLDSAAGGVGVDLEDARRVVEGVEARRAAGADVADLLACLEFPDALGEGVNDTAPG